MLDAGAFTATSDQDGVRRTTTDFRPGKRLTIRQIIAGTGRKAARMAEQLRGREIRHGGDGSITDIVFGSSTTSFEDGTRRTVNLLLDGASVSTIFHEETHGYWKEALATGRLTRDEAITLLRAVDNVLANHKGRKGSKETNLRLLPDNDADITDVMLDEAIAELREAEILRTRKDGIVPEGLISRNFAAIARLTGDRTAGKFRSFFDAIRARFGLILDRSNAIKRGLSDGSINKADYEAFFGRLTGRKEGQSTITGQSGLDPAKVAEFIGTDEDVSFNTNDAPFPTPSLIRPLDSPTNPQQNTNDERLREPIQILEALRAEAQDLGQGGIRTNAGKRRKHGKEFSGDSGLLAWAQRNGRILESGPIQSVGDEDAPGGGEHKVIYDEDSQRVIKLTKPGLFGAQAEDALAYIERWALHNRAFGDDVAFEGLVTLPGEHAPRAVISQRYAEGRDATTEEQADLLNSKGFHEQADGRWIHPIRGITVWDTITPGNIIATPDGMRVIDLQVATTPSKELAQVRAQTGIGRENSFSIGSDPSSGDAEARIKKATAEARKKMATVDAESIKRVGRFWLSLHGEKGVSQLQELKGKDMRSLVDEAKQTFPNLKFYHWQDGDTDVTRLYDGVGEADISVSGGKVWVETTRAGGHGSSSPRNWSTRAKASMAPGVYQIAQAYAKNNGLKFIPDPDGVSALAIFRRWPQLLSSAIRVGDTSHINGTEDVEGWKDGDHEHNAGLLALHEYEYVRQFFPEIDGLHLSEDSSTIVDDAGAPVSNATLTDLLVGERHPKRLGIGEATLRRAIVTGQEAAQGRLESESEAGIGNSGERRIHPGAIESFRPDLGSGDSGTGPRRHALEGISYSVGHSTPGGDPPAAKSKPAAAKKAPGKKAAKKKGSSSAGPPPAPSTTSPAPSTSPTAKPPLTYQGETVDAAWYQRKAEEATRHPSSPRVILGKYSRTGVSYEKVAEGLKNTYFQLDDWTDLVKVLDKPHLLWPINEAFLDQQLDAGKEIWFSHDPDKADGYFLLEVEHIKNRLHGTDFSFEPDGALFKLVRK